MSWLNRIWNMLRSHSLQKDLDEELQLHIEMRARELERSGLTAQGAREAALRQFGNSTLQTERMRKMDIAAWMETVLSDLRYALRQLVRNPIFAAMAVLSLALGIGANAAIFRVMNAVLLKMLPVHDPQQLVSLTNPDHSYRWSGTDSGERMAISYPEFLQLRERLTTLSGLCAAETELDRWQVRIAGGQQESVQGRMVSEEYFSVLGVDAAMGRVLQPSDARGPNQDPYVVISYNFWQRRFGGRTDVLGTPIKFNAGALTVIGVAERGFKGESGGEDPDLWLPILMQPLVEPGHDLLHEDPSQSLQKVVWLHAFGRMKPESTLNKVQAETGAVFKAMMEWFYPPTLPGEARKEALSQYLLVQSAQTGGFDGREDYVLQLTILLSIAGLVLLIACANVANLLLARATGRRREVAIRLSIGASRGRLFRQFFTESLLLSMLGSVAGLFIASSGAHLLVRLLSDPGDALDLSTGLDWRVVTFTIAVTVFTAILFGIAPSLRASRADLNSSIRDAETNTHSARRLSLSKGLVIGQVGLSLLLVVGAGLFLRTLWNLRSVELGYPKEHLLQVRVDGRAVAQTNEQLSNLYHQIAARLSTVPGVRGVTYSELGLINGGESNTHIQVEGFTPQIDEDRESRFDQIAPGYFSVIGVPLLLGRDLGPQDTATSTPVCVINEELAMRFFAGRSPIGRHIMPKYSNYSSPVEIVGVVKNVRSRSLKEPIPQRFYLPVDQGSEGKIAAEITFEIRTVDEPTSIAASATKAILEVNPDVPISSARSMEELVENRTTFTRMIAQLCVIFGGLALLLAATGLYGLLSYGVVRRTNEIGIRMALGAGRASVVGMILRETGIMVSVGLVAGIAAAIAGTQLIVSQLYGLSTVDPVTYVAAATVLGVVSLIAGYIPATRAANIDPVGALRHD